MKILTFDIEDWFHILDLGEVNAKEKWSAYETRVEKGLDIVLSDLLDRDIKATFFCLGWVAEKYPSMIKKISDSGFHIASHSYAHDLVYKYDKDHFREDLNKSIRILEDITGNLIDTYRAPGFSVTSDTPWYIEEISRAGITKDSSIFPSTRGHGGFPSFEQSSPSIVTYKNHSIKEFPINLANILGRSFIFSGGGYFRFLPLPALKYYFSKSDYTMTYFHMRDFDPFQPKLSMSAIRRFKSYYGLNKSWNKYLAILDNYDFIDLNQADSLIDWNNAPKVKL